MKLKKIASLALAGIMAVSMLAGCNGASSSNPTEPENPAVPSTYNVAEYLNDILTEKQSKKISFTDNSTLRSNTLAIATDSSVVTRKIISNAAQTATPDSTISGKVADQYKSGSFETADWGKWVKTVPADNSGVDYYLCTYVLDGDMNELKVADAIYDNWSNSIDDDLKNQISGKEVIWSGDIAVVKVYNSKSVDDTAWVVSVVITKTMTNGTNTQV